MSDCLHEPNAADLPRMPGSLGEQVRQARSAPGQTLASCHATARRILDDMKRGAIHKRIRASFLWAASAGLRCEFPCTALCARWRVAGHHFSLAFLVQAFCAGEGHAAELFRFNGRRFVTCAQATLWTSSKFIYHLIVPGLSGERLPRCPRLWRGRSLHNERLDVCRVPRPGYFSTQACTAPRSCDGATCDGAWKRSRGGGFGTSAGTMGGNAPGCAFRGGADSYFDALDGATAIAVRRATSLLASPDGSADFSRTWWPVAGTSCEIEPSNQHDRLFGEVFD